MLVKTKAQWCFESELALETVVWENLGSLFSLAPLKRQYQCQGEICDIVASDANNGLVILELKNSEDRYIVQQLTRYYDNLIQERPLPKQIDYSRPVRLIAIAPSFHRHNFIDQKYLRLDLEFFTCKIIQSDEIFSLQLQSIEAQESKIIKLAYTQVQVSQSSGLPKPPQMLLDRLGGWPIEAQQNIFKLRERILLSDPRMQETVSGQSIYYGRGKQNCAELYFDKKQQSPILFLWLQLWRYEKNATGRHRIWTDWERILFWAHVPTGLGQAKTREEWKQIPQNKWPRKHLEMGRSLIADSFHSELSTRLGCKESTSSLIPIVDAALERWQTRL
ncbi:MAG: DUF91 domain-containing protein [Trichocoleus desertorum ATA4-8-CV12]|jgi:RecB family endonuclease NucS|nr:DUF91 domain-containing protein [Trichocoleus desertorum ATA4-8-CV12]